MKQHSRGEPVLRQIIVRDLFIHLGDRNGSVFVRDTMA
jgi:hypothetical protein